MQPGGLGLWLRSSPTLNAEVRSDHLKMRKLGRHVVGVRVGAWRSCLLDPSEIIAVVQYSFLVHAALSVVADEIWFPISTCYGAWSEAGSSSTHPLPRWP